MADETRAPSGYIENAGILGLCGAIGLAINSSLDLSSEWAMVVTLAAPIVGKWLQLLAANFFGSNIGDVIKPSARLIPLLFALGLAAPSPSHAAQEIPPIGCGAGSCSLYVFDVGWPGGVGINAVEFVRFRVGADLPMVVQDAHISPIGGACLIPKLKDAITFLCPKPVQ